MSALKQVVPKGYKQTEVGFIPDEWKIEPISECMKLINGYGFKPHQWSKHGLPIIRIQNLNSDNAMFNYFEGSVEEKFHVQKGDILFAWSGSKGSSFGARVWQGAPAILNQHIFRVVPNPQTLTAQYSFYVLRKVQEQIEKMAHGFKSSFVHVKKEDLGSTPLPIPSKEEQAAIANALSDVDALLAELEKLIAKKQAIKTATMQQLLTGKTRLTQFATYTEGEKLGQPKGTKSSELGEIPEDWDVKAMGDLGTTFGGLSGKNKNDFGHGRGRYVPFTNVMANTVIDEEHLEKVDVNEPQNEVRKNDLLFNGSSETPDEVCFCSMVASEIDNLFLNSFCFGFRAKSQGNYIPLYLAYWFRSNNGRSAVSIMAQGSTRYNISKSQFLRLSTVLPPIEEQTAIASIFSDMDREIQTLEQRLAKTRQIKQGMMQELLTGRTRLPFETEY